MKSITADRIQQICSKRETNSNNSAENAAYERHAVKFYIFSSSSLDLKIGIE